MKEKIGRINQLDNQIRDIEHAIRIFNPQANIIRGDGSKDIHSIIKIERKSRVSIFGSRRFGVGTHKIEIELPSSMVSDIEKIMLSRLNELRIELNNLLNLKPDAPEIPENADDLHKKKQRKP